MFWFLLSDLLFLTDENWKIESFSSIEKKLYDRKADRK